MVTVLFIFLGFVLLPAIFFTTYNANCFVSLLQWLKVVVEIFKDVLCATIEKELSSDIHEDVWW